jgi:hypothetical protein
MHIPEGFGGLVVNMLASGSRVRGFDRRARWKAYQDTGRGNKVGNYLSTLETPKSYLNEGRPWNKLAVGDAGYQRQRGVIRKVCDNVDSKGQL